MGSNLLHGLEQRGRQDLVICDVFGQDDKWQNIRKRELYDVIAPEGLKDYLDQYGKEIEIIFHCAAKVSTTERDADKMIEHNFKLSRDLAKWAADNEVRFIYLSSYSTYGDGKNGFDDSDDIEKLKRLDPLSPYGWSKHLFDKFMVRWQKNTNDGKAQKLPPQWVGLKLFNVFGPNEYHKDDQMSVVCKLYPQAMAGAAARLFKSRNPDYEDGGQLRDFIYIDDVIDVILWFFDNPDKNGLYNVGSGKARSFKDLAMSVFRAAKMEPKINYVDMSESLSRRYQYYTEANIKKLRDAGYTKSFMELEDGVEEFVNKYLSGSDPYK